MDYLDKEDVFRSDKSLTYIVFNNAILHDGMGYSYLIDKYCFNRSCRICKMGLSNKPVGANCYQFILRRIIESKCGR